MEDEYGDKSAKLWDADELDCRSSDIRETVTKIFAHAHKIAEKHGLSGEAPRLNILENKDWWEQTEDVRESNFDFSDFLRDAQTINLGPILAKKRHIPFLKS